MARILNQRKKVFRSGNSRSVAYIYNGSCVCACVCRNGWYFKSFSRGSFFLFFLSCLPVTSQAKTNPKELGEHRQNEENKIQNALNTHTHTQLCAGVFINSKRRVLLRIVVTRSYFSGRRFISPPPPPKHRV